MKIASNGFLCVSLIALVLGLLPLYGCGGGGGSGGGSGGGGSDGGALALDSVISKAEDEDAEQKISEAAENKPGRGSVTQSSNASNDGVTTDRVSVTASYSGGQVQYIVQNSTAAWSVDSAVDTVLARPADSTWDGAELMKRLPNGDLYVDVYSEKRVRENKDYVAGGFWIFVPDNATRVDDLDLGVFGHGSDPFRGDFPTSGFGKHVGQATFMYSEDGIINFAEGTVRLDVDFTGEMVSGRIIVLDDGGYPTGVELSLKLAPFDDSNSDFFQGNTDLSQTRGFSGQGKWGGQFFGNGSGTPRVAGGTFGVTGRNANGDEIAALGVWAVPLDPNEIDSVPDTDTPPTSQGDIPPTTSKCGTGTAVGQSCTAGSPRGTVTLNPDGSCMVGSSFTGTGNFIVDGVNICKQAADDAGIDWEPGSGFGDGM